ncbi:G1/S-specific cyclin-E2-like isoform X2 [Betta splendens]|nr:G1/S-specific cyclin-E2-like isoform X2 [Betta splendens]
MTRGSGCLQKRAKKSSGKKRRVQDNNIKVEVLLKVQCKKTQKLGSDGDRPCCPDALVCPSCLSCTGWDAVEDVLVNAARGTQRLGHSLTFMQKHPKIQPQMRSILLDWLIEVSEAYTLHRQTFYLAQDYFDRFMLTQKNLDKSVLQLIGVTCLFIASKMEEANPPKLSEMACVTAGAFYEDEILKMELIILQALNWSLRSETALSWLRLFLQIASMNVTSELLESQFPPEVYVQMTRLLDLCGLSIDSLDFSPHVLAASVCCHFLNQERVLRISGLSEDLIQPCINWMVPFADSIGHFGRAPLKDFARICGDDSHNIQTHADYMTMLDEVSKKQATIQLLPEQTCTG